MCTIRRFWIRRFCRPTLSTFWGFDVEYRLNLVQAIRHLCIFGFDSRSLVLHVEQWFSTICDVNNFQAPFLGRRFNFGCLCNSLATLNFGWLFRQFLSHSCSTCQPDSILDVDSIYSGSPNTGTWVQFWTPFLGGCFTFRLYSWALNTGQIQLFYVIQIQFNWLTFFFDTTSRIWTLGRLRLLTVWKSDCCILLFDHKFWLDKFGPLESVTFRLLGTRSLFGQLGLGYFVLDISSCWHQF